MTVRELIERLQKENQDLEVDLYVAGYDEEKVHFCIENQFIDDLNEQSTQRENEASNETL